jgi:hypothetical protein
MPSLRSTRSSNSLASSSRSKERERRVRRARSLQQSGNNSRLVGNLDDETSETDRQKKDPGNGQTDGQKPPQEFPNQVHQLLGGEFAAMPNTYVKQIALGIMNPELVMQMSTDKRTVDPQRVLFLFSLRNPIRRAIIFLGNSLPFNFVIYSSIICQCIFLIFTPAFPDMPGQEKPVLSLAIMELANTGFTIFFTLEFFVRVMHVGLLFTPTAYFRSGWNVVDFIVLLFSWASIFEIMGSAKYVKVVRLARALRPLRLIKRIRGA